MFIVLTRVGSRGPVAVNADRIWTLVPDSGGTIIENGEDGLLQVVEPLDVVLVQIASAGRDPLILINRLRAALAGPHAGIVESDV